MKRTLKTIRTCGDDVQRAEADFIEQVLDEAYRAPEAVNFARSEPAKAEAKQ